MPESPAPDPSPDQPTKQQSPKRVAREPDPVPPALAPSPSRDHNTSRRVPRRIGGTDGNRYKVGEELGKGGFGIVYKGFDHELKRPVAIKAGMDVDPEAVNRFQKEARIVARLKHDHIVAVHDLIHVNGVLCIVMDFIDGMSLEKMRSKGIRMLPEDAAKMIMSLADALQHIHHHGLIHMDVKPGNILVDGNGESHLTDLGLTLKKARIHGVDGLVGTPAYMSPEQTRNDSLLDDRSDIFSLGIVFYELLYGKLPFGGKDKNGVEKPLPILLGEIRSDTPVAFPESATVPKELEPILRKMLAKNPEDRYQTAGELYVDLENFLEPARHYDLEYKDNFGIFRNLTLDGKETNILALIEPAHKSANPNSLETLDECVSAVQKAMVNPEFGREEYTNTRTRLNDINHAVESALEDPTLGMSKEEFDTLARDNPDVRQQIEGSLGELLAQTGRTTGKCISKLTTSSRKNGTRRR